MRDLAFCRASNLTVNFGVGVFFVVNLLPFSLCQIDVGFGGTGSLTMSWTFSAGARLLSRKLLLELILCCPVPRIF